RRDRDGVRVRYRTIHRAGRIGSVVRLEHPARFGQQHHPLPAVEHLRGVQQRRQRAARALRRDPPAAGLHRRPRHHCAARLTPAGVRPAGPRFPGAVRVRAGTREGAPRPLGASVPSADIGGPASTGPRGKAATTEGGAMAGEVDGRMVLAVDGSASALGAARWGALTARLRALPVTIVTAVELPVPRTGSASLSAEAMALLRSRGERALDAALSQVREILGPDHPVDRGLWEGPPIPQLLAHSDRAAMLVLGVRGLGDAPESIAGSVAT